MIKTVLLDLDDTLLDFKAGERAAISATLCELGLSNTDENIALYSKINDECWKKLELGIYTTEELLYKRFDILFDKLDVVRDSVYTKTFYERCLSQSNYLIDGAIELLEKLVQKYSLYLVTNGTSAVQRQRICQAGIEKYFDGIFISEEIGHTKPDPNFFKEVFKRISCKKENTVIIGDSLSSDIKGGLGAGIITCLFNPSGKLLSTEVMPHYTVKSLEDIPDLLEKL